jgi:hypothetical protein
MREEINPKPPHKNPHKGMVATEIKLSLHMYIATMEHLSLLVFINMKSSRNDQLLPTSTGFTCTTPRMSRTHRPLVHHPRVPVGWIPPYLHIPYELMSLLNTTYHLNFIFLTHFLIHI